MTRTLNLGKSGSIWRARPEGAAIDALMRMAWERGRVCVVLDVGVVASPGAGRFGV